MAMTIHCSTHEKISIEECFDAAIGMVDPARPETITEFAPIIKKLSNNATAVSTALCGYLKDFSHIEYGGINYSPNSFLLSPAHPTFIIRANIWLPLCSHKERQVFEANLFAYHRAHNHNFHFLTIGHFGPGYATDIYSYDRSAIAGYLNEPVNMALVERTVLTPGKVMFYQADKDIHTQYPSTSVSVSLNLIVVSDEDRLRDQYFFDTAQGAISGYSDTLATKRVSLLRMAAWMADQNMIDVLADIARHHPCHRTRLQAFQSLSLAGPEYMDYWHRLAGADSNPAVRNFIHHGMSVANPQSSFDPAFMQLV